MRDHPAPTTTIARELSKFKKSKNPKFLLSALILLVASGRLLEILYGAYCFILHLPSKVIPRENVTLKLYQDELTLALANIRSERNRAIDAIEPQIPSSGEALYCMDHGFAEIEGGWILSEYASYSARIFYLSAGDLKVVDTYQQRKGVRHIHMVFRVGQKVYIATGDTDKFLDEWHLDGNALRFEKRIIRRFGGFTTACRIDGKTYFGSDFSERPNYIYCLETGQKWFFPRPSYTRYCYLMLVSGPYIFCFNRGLARLSGGMSVSVFDTQSKQFVFAEEYTGDVFVSDYKGTI